MSSVVWKNSVCSFERAIDVTSARASFDAESLQQLLDAYRVLRRPPVPRRIGGRRRRVERRSRVFVHRRRTVGRPVGADRAAPLGLVEEPLEEQGDVAGRGGTALVQDALQIAVHLARVLV